MKKIVLLFGLCLLTVVANAQVIFNVLDPSPNAGTYDITFAEPGAMWTVPDLTDPLNSVSANMVLVDDGAGLTNPIACVPVINDLTGNIAVLYRGTCEFGSKALNAQNAGAIGVIIINNLAGAPVAMGGGADGAAVTIPVVMISDINGALLRDEIDAGMTEVFIGSKTGLFSNDLGMSPGGILRAESFGNLQQLSQSDAEFEVEMGAWIVNFGTNNQTGVILNATIELDGVELYNENSDPSMLDAAGGAIDSLFISLPTFSQPSYANGYYHVTYSVSSGAMDESGFDNELDADFVINEEVFSKASLDETTMIPTNSINQFNGSTDNLFSCLYFTDPNASRIGVRGMNFSAGTSQNPDPTTLDGELVEAFIYNWDDVWVDLNDPDFNILSLDPIANQEFIYTSDAQGENIFIELEEPVLLEDDQKYLFCVQMYGNIIFPGYDTKTDYSQNVNEFAQPISPLFSSGQWFALGFGADLNPSISVQMFDASELGLVELPTVDLEAFPNPASEIVHVPVDFVEGNVAMTIVDVNGRIVDNQNVTMTNSRLDVDVTSLASGQYIINLAFENGKRGAINVVVSR